MADESEARVHYLPECYREDIWSYEFMKSRGITQIDGTPDAEPDRATATRNGSHDSFRSTTQMAVQDRAAGRRTKSRRGWHRSTLATANHRFPQPA